MLVHRSVYMYPIDQDDLLVTGIEGILPHTTGMCMHTLRLVNLIELWVVRSCIE